jgi:hypothetical protein
MNVKSAATLALLSSVALLSGCTRSLEVRYAAGFEVGAAPRAQAATKIAILPFVDARAWVDQADPQTASFVGKAGPWKFGLTYGEQEYVPVSTLLQRLFVDEFKAAGYDAAAAGSAASDGYTLSGRILTFEFENETGLVTVTSRRSVTLALTLTGRGGVKVFDEQLFSQNDRENEGLGVMHSTNADKLLNKVFKKVVGDVLLKVQPMIAGSGPVEVHVSVNGIRVLDLSNVMVASNAR